MCVCSSAWIERSAPTCTVYRYHSPKFPERYHFPFGIARLHRNPLTIVVVRRIPFRFTPFRLSIFCLISAKIEYASVAQLDRAFGSDPEGRWFESSRAHQKHATTSKMLANPEVMALLTALAKQMG